jgi:hypothetical protein
MRKIWLLLRLLLEASAIMLSVRILADILCHHILRGDKKDD